MHQRPDGALANALGWILIGTGLFSAFFGATAETTNGFLVGMLIANLGIGLGVLLCSLGYLVRSIWFLPGREIPLDQPATAPPTANCDYCGRGVAAPARPCSAVAVDELVGLQDKIDDEKCIALLRERNFLPTPEGS